MSSSSDFSGYTVVTRNESEAMSNVLEASADLLLSRPSTSPAELPTGETGMSPSEPPPKEAKKVRPPQRPVKLTLRYSRARCLKLTVPYKSEGRKVGNSKWTIVERQQLLDALKQHGSSDVEKLAQAVPTRSVTAINHFLMECWRKDRVVVQDAAGKRATQAVRILRRALDVTRRRYDSSQWLSQVVASCQRESCKTTYHGEDIPRFEDVYQMLRDVMEDKVPAALGACEQYVVCRALGTLVALVASLNLNEEREVLRKQFTAAQPAMGSTMESAKKPRTGAGKDYSPTFPSMSTRMENLMASWNPLRLPPEIIQKSRDSIADLLAGGRQVLMRSMIPEE